MAELESKQTSPKNTLLWISNAIKVLEEGLSKYKESNAGIKMTQSSKASKQQTLDYLPVKSEEDAEKIVSRKTEKQIVITEISTLTKVDELALKVAFRLFPSKTAFSKVQFDLCFDNLQISSISIRIPQGPLSADEFDLTPVLDMKGVHAASHTIRVELYELWSSGEKLSQAVNELTVDYVPQTRESKFVKVPSIKSIAGTDLAVVSESEADIYRKIEKTMKKEQLTKRDNY